MNKKLLAALLALILCLSGAAPALAYSRPMMEPTYCHEDHFFLSEKRYSYPDGSWGIRTYDAAGNELRYEGSRGDWTAFTYDAAGNKTRYESSSGSWKDYTYDAAGNMTREDPSDGKWITYTFDAAGNLTRFDTFLGDWAAYTFDAAGNETRYEASSGHWTTWAYDAAGNLTRYETSDGDWRTWAYDAAGNETRYEDSNGDWYVYLYDAAGKRTQYENASGINEIYTYDAAGRLTKYQEPFCYESYTYDDAGNLIGKEETTPPLFPGTQPRWWSYTYDAAGNTTTMKSTGSGDLTWTFAYDAAGNLTREDDGYGWITYAYDAAGNLVRSEEDDGTVITYTYTPRAATYADEGRQTILVDGAAIEFQTYYLTDENGGVTNYVRLRDLAYILNESAAAFEVGYDRRISITGGQNYTATGSEMQTPFSGQWKYRLYRDPVIINGVEQTLDAITLTDENGGDYTYFKLRDLGRALGFDVSWSAEKGLYLDTGQPYTDE